MRCSEAQQKLGGRLGGFYPDREVLSVKEDLRVCRRKRRCGIKQRRYLFCKADTRSLEDFVVSDGAG